MSKKTAHKTGDRRGKTGRSIETQFKPGNIYAWPKGFTPNPGGRPKKLSDAYREWLELPSKENPDITNAQAIAARQGHEAAQGDVTAAKEIRQATEGERSITIDVTKLNDRQLELAISGADIPTILAAASSSGEGTAQADQGDDESGEA